MHIIIDEGDTIPGYWCVIDPKAGMVWPFHWRIIARLVCWWLNRRYASS